MLAECATSFASGETAAITTVAQSRVQPMSNTSLRSSVSLLRRYGTCGSSLLPPLEDEALPPADAIYQPPPPRARGTT